MDFALFAFSAALLGQLTYRRLSHCAVKLTLIAEHGNDAAMDPIALCTACENENMSTRRFFRVSGGSAVQQLHPGNNMAPQAR